MKRLNIIIISIFFLFSCSKKTPNGDIKTKNDNPLYDQAFEYLVKKDTRNAFLYFNKAKDLFLQQKDSLGVGKCLLNMAIISTNNGDYYGQGEGAGCDTMRRRGHENSRGNGIQTKAHDRDRRTPYSMAYNEVLLPLRV